MSEHPALGLIYHLLSREYFAASGAGVTFFNHVWTMHWPPGEIDLRDYGYSPEHKMRQLNRHYWNPESAQAIKDKLRSRKSQSMSLFSMSMHGKPKNVRSSGWCMEALQIRTWKRKTEAILLFRTSELLHGLPADLEFIRQILQRLEIEPITLTLYMSNAWINLMFLPSLFQFIEPPSFFEWVAKISPTFHKLSFEYFKRHYLIEKPPSLMMMRRQHRLMQQDPEWREWKAWAGRQT